jgi:carboxyl-terminal processing protease
MNRLSKILVVSLSTVIFSYAGLGYLLGKTGDDKTYRSLTVFSEVLEHIAHDYVEEPNLRQVSVGAMHGLLDSLDPQSSYLSPLEYADYKKKVDDKSKDAVGVALSKRFGYIVIVSVLPESPAQKAGLHSGDILESISGFTTHDMAIGQAQILLSGNPDTSVRVSVIRRGHSEPQELDIVHTKTAPPKLVEDRLEGDIAYLRVPVFDAGTANQIREKLVQFEKQGAHKLILDLRDCALGQIPEAVSTAQLFLNSGTITTLHGQTVPPQTFSADPAKVAWKQPMTVLISGSTAGPAEVLAAAIAGNHRGDTVGNRTFGTASEQRVIPLDDGAALILTVANYFTPDSKSIPSEGVTPTVEVRPSPEDSAALIDQDETGLQPGKPPSPEDPVMKKAIEILQGAASQRRAA